MRTIVATVLLLAGFGLIGWVALDDTGDDVGSVSIDAGEQPATTETSPATPPPAEPPATEPPATDPSEATGTDADDAPARTAPQLVVPAIQTSSARIGDVDLTPPPAPTTVSASAFGVDARVVPVGVDPDGTMEIPEDVRTIGWYRLGSAPADDEGTIILVGHVDSRTQGRGAFFDLRVADVGDEVSVVDEQGTETIWRVTGRRTWDKDELPADEVYRRDGPARLLLITCGGDFDADVGSYESNVVVEAEPVE